MSSRTPRRTKRQKLLDAVSQERDRLLDAARARQGGAVEGAMYPSGEMSERFFRYSLALRSLVTHHLAAPGWEMSEESSRSSWAWNGHVGCFYFDYESFASLPRATEEHVNRKAPRLRVLARLAFDPGQPLDAELARVAGEAKHYRDCVELLEQEVYRRAVRAEADAVRVGDGTARSSETSTVE